MTSSLSVSTGLITGGAQIPSDLNLAPNTRPVALTFDHIIESLPSGHTEGHRPTFPGTGGKSNETPGTKATITNDLQALNYDAANNFSAVPKDLQNLKQIIDKTYPAGTTSSQFTPKTLQDLRQLSTDVGNKDAGNSLGDASRIFQDLGIQGVGPLFPKVSSPANTTGSPLSQIENQFGTISGDIGFNKSAEPQDLQTLKQTIDKFFPAGSTSSSVTPKTLADLRTLSTDIGNNNIQAAENDIGTVEADLGEVATPG